MRGGFFLLFLLIVIPHPTKAVTQSITATVQFDTPLSQNKIHDAQIGTVKAGQAGVYVLDTNNAVTPSGGGVWMYGSPLAASLTIAGSRTQAVTISTGNYISNNGVTPSSATCRYGAGGAVPCDFGVAGIAPGAATPLLVGLRVTADGTQGAGTMAAPSFTVTTVYD